MKTQIILFLKDADPYLIARDKSRLLIYSFPYNRGESMGNFSEDKIEALLKHYYLRLDDPVWWDIGDIEGARKIGQELAVQRI